MPFVNLAHRLDPDMSVPGDRCYVSYKRMVEEWKVNPRWTTANEIYTKITDYKQFCDRTRLLNKEACQGCVATELAWQVFFIKYVMPYEDLKEKENGTI